MLPGPGSSTMNLACILGPPLGDFGFCIVVVSVLLVAGPNRAVWILELGFWILHKIIATTRRLGSAD